MKNIIVILLTLFCATTFAQNQVPGNSLKIGSPNKNNKDLIFEIGNGNTNPRFRGNGTSGLLQYSNDGVTFNNFTPGGILNKTVITGAYTPTSADDVIMANTAGGGFTVTMPAASTSGVNGKVFYFTKTSAANTLTIARTGTDTLCGATSLSMIGLNDSIILYSDGTNWIGMGSSCNGAFSRHVSAGRVAVDTITNVNVDYTATQNDQTIMVDSTVATRNVTLPNPATVPGKIYYIGQSSSINQVIILPGGGTVCRRSSIRLHGVSDRVMLQSDGTNWIDPNGSCSITRTARRDTGNGISNTDGYNWVTCTSTRCTYNSGVFQGSVGCAMTHESAGVNTGTYFAQGSVPNVSFFDYTTWVGSSGTNQGIDFVCFGTR